MMNPHLTKLEREKLERQINEYFAQGNELKVIGHQMKSKPIQMVINPKKGFEDNIRKSKY